jgi:hypothetical protein
MSKIHNYFFPVVSVPWQAQDVLETMADAGQILALDIDDTLADFLGGIEERYGAYIPEENNGADWRLERMYPGINWSEELRKPDLALELKPLEHSKELAMEITKRVPFVYLSARPVELNYATAHWLNNHGYPPAPVMCVGKDLKKGLLRSGIFGFIIDDSPSVMRIAKEVKAKRICIATPWNEGEQYRMNVKEALHEVQSL